MKLIARNARIEKEISDIDRIKTLLEEGYLPRFIDSINTRFATEAVDWAIRNTYGPPYWDNSGFVKYCDRSRIDQYIRDRQIAK